MSMESKTETAYFCYHGAPSELLHTSFVENVSGLCMLFTVYKESSCLVYPVKLERN